VIAKCILSEPKHGEVWQSVAKDPRNASKGGGDLEDCSQQVGIGQYNTVRYCQRRKRLAILAVQGLRSVTSKLRCGYYLNVGTYQYRRTYNGGQEMKHHIESPNILLYENIASED
jgi:hypothetical protein